MLPFSALNAKLDRWIASQRDRGLSPAHGPQAARPPVARRPHRRGRRGDGCRRSPPSRSSSTAGCSRRCSRARAALLVTLPARDLAHEPACCSRWSRSIRAVADGIGEPARPRLQRERDAHRPGRDRRPDGRVQLARRQPAARAARPLPARTPARHGRADDAARARADERERPRRVRQHRGAAALPRRSQDRGHPLRRSCWRRRRSRCARRWRAASTRCSR